MAAFLKRAGAIPRPGSGAACGAGDVPPDRLFLVGMMGAGKTSVGEQLARRAGLDFIDADRELQHRFGTTIAAMFADEGEAAFRRREAELLDELTLRDGAIIATGGGAVLDPVSREHLRRRGRTIYLHASPAVLWRRTCGDTERPLLRVAEPLAALIALYAVRDPLYRDCSGAVIDTAELAPTGVARIIATLMAHAALPDVRA
jgi:shikimate kinase